MSFESVINAIIESIYAMIEVSKTMTETPTNILNKYFMNPTKDIDVWVTLIDLGI